jgi:hypothetical protein
MQRWRREEGFMKESRGGRGRESRPHPGVPSEGDLSPDLPFTVIQPARGGEGASSGCHCVAMARSSWEYCIERASTTVFAM